MNEAVQPVGMPAQGLAALAARHPEAAERIERAGADTVGNPPAARWPSGLDVAELARTIGDGLAVANLSGRSDSADDADGA